MSVTHKVVLQILFVTLSCLTSFYIACNCSYCSNGLVTFLFNQVVEIGPSLLSSTSAVAAWRQTDVVACLMWTCLVITHRVLVLMSRACVCVFCCSLWSHITIYQ